MEIIYHWHSFIEFDWILIDPFITSNPKCDITIENILENDIKYVILTHWHYDHYWDVEILAEKKEITIIAVYELARFLLERWYKVHSMHIWWWVNLWDFQVRFTPATHWWLIMDSWLYSPPTWVLVKKDWYVIYHAWDTWLDYNMKLLWDYERIDVAFLPIWWNFTMDVDQAVIATSFIKPRYVVPIHYDTWPIIQADPIDFAKKIMLNNLSIPKVLQPWQSIVL